MELDTAINYIFDGDALLFVGAGFSRDTVNSGGSLIPTTNKLSEKLQLNLGIDIKDVDTNINIQQVAEYFLDQKGKSELTKILREEFEVTDTKKYHDSITKQNWRRIYTTNYDNILEVSSTKNGNRRYPVNVNEKKKRPKTEDRKQIIHINGYIDDINNDTLLTDTKLTNSSYIENNFLEGHWRTEFDIDLDHSKAIFFIGFSLNYDLDLKRIIAQNKTWKEKIFFINGKLNNIFEKNNLGKFGNVLEMDAQEFACKLEEEYKEFIPKTKSNETLYSFKSQKPLVTKDKILDQDISKLFFAGFIDVEKLYTYGNEKGKYIVKRAVVDQTLKLIENKELVICHSEFGNGKTVFLKNLESVAIQNGYYVFSFQGNPNDISHDIDVLNKIDIRKGIITIDDYYGLKSEFRYFNKLDKEKFTLVITGRSAIHHNMIDNLVDKGGFNKARISTISVNYLEESDIIQIYDLMEHHNLWGMNASLSKNKKISLLKKKSDNNFKNIMFNIFESQNMFDKLFKLYQELHLELKELVIVSLINNVLRSGLSFSQILILSDKLGINSNFTNEVNFKEFIDYDNGIVIMNSSMASLEIIKRIENKKIIIEIMENLVKKADRIDSQKTYNYLKRELVSFSNFKLIFTGSSKEELNDLAIKYFEGIRNTEFAKKNPFFWLQYAIQKLEIEDYDMAETFFDNAYSYANSMGYYDFYQLHAQKARLLIEKSIKLNSEIDQAFLNFEQAHSLLSKDLNHPDNNPVYQLRQSEQYTKFHEKFYNRFEPSMQIVISRYYREMSHHLENYIQDSKNKNGKTENRIVEANKSIKKILLKV